jgi:hypothetical protein
MPQIVEVIVGVDVNGKDEFDELAAAAEAAGLKFRPGGRMFTLGALAGTIERGALERLRSLPGVFSVEESRSFQVPPDGDPQ